jgi:hypothetical protein
VGALSPSGDRRCGVNVPILPRSHAPLVTLRFDPPAS